MGEYDSSSVFADRYFNWYKNHAGARADWLRTDMISRIKHSHPLAGRRILDFGCGTGSSSVVLGENGAMVIGAETEQKALAVAARRARDLDVTSHCSFVRIPYLGALPFRDASFDVCTLVGVLEYMKPNERQ